MPLSDGGDDQRSNKTDTKPGGTPPPQDHSNTILYFQPSHRVKKFAKKYRTEIAACTSSVLSTFIAFPLDFTKSRMQSYETDLRHTVQDAYRAEGVRAFWRGVVPPLVSVMLVRTISFSVYQRAKYAYDRTLTDITGQSPLKLANAPGSYPSFLTMACFGAAGATSGAVVTTLSCPFELTKLNEQLAGKEARQQASSLGGANTSTSNSASSGAMSSVRAGSWATARRVVRDRGLLGLYAGYRLHLLRDTIGTSIYFTTYESTKQLMANARGKSPTSPYAVVVAGGMCGIVSWACIYPIDVAKTLYQKALLSAGSGVAERPRIRFFEFGAYRGLGVSVMRSCIINAIFFSVFEFLKKRINALDVEDTRKVGD